MRRLLYIPIIHEEADLGSAGPDLARGSSTLAGEHRWALHQETVRGFWESVERSLRRFDPRKVRVYQDGMAADGALGRRIVEEGTRRGSRNYQLVLALLDRGAVLQATEDLALLQQEQESLRSPGRQQVSPGQRRRLLERRDANIAQAINATLREGEVGVLFIGAGHDVRPSLADDILVQRAKDPERLRLYIQELLLGDDPGRLATLATYVAAPVEDCGAEG